MQYLGVSFFSFLIAFHYFCMLVFLSNFLVVIANLDPPATIDLYDSFLSNVKIKSFKSLRRGEIKFLKYLTMNGFVASCLSDATVNIWNPNTGESIRIYTQHTEWVICLDQIDEDTLVSGSADNTIHIWEISSGKNLKRIKVDDSVNSIKSLSSSLIACGLYRNINIYDYSTGNLTKTLIGHSNYVNSIEMLSEQYMASGGYDQKVIIWDLTSYSIKYILTEHKVEIKCVKRLSSNLIASGDSIGLIIIWNWLNGSLIHRLNNHTRPVSSLDLYDDKTMISGSWDQTIKFWNIANGQLINTINTDIEINALSMLNIGIKIPLITLITQRENTKNLKFPKNILNRRNDVIFTFDSEICAPK
jgi:WD40 repeat protein